MSIQDLLTYVSLIRFTQRERIELSMLGCTATIGISYKIAYVLGVHFRAGEWGCRRCGSVITTIFEGRSRYCNVTKFVRVGRRNFACVEWLSEPRYPYAPMTVVARVGLLSRDRQLKMPILIPLESIDPTPVLVEPDTDGRHFYMMRVHGYDSTGS